MQKEEMKRKLTILLHEEHRENMDLKMGDAAKIVDQAAEMIWRGLKAEQIVEANS